MLYYISDLNKELFITWKRWYSDHKFSQSIDFDSPTVCRDLGGQPSYLEGLWESFSQVASSGRSHTRLLSLAVSLSCKFLISVCFHNTCILSGFMPFALFYFNTDGSFSSWQEKKWEGHLLKWARHGNYTLTNAALCKLRQHDHKFKANLGSGVSLRPVSQSPTPHGKLRINPNTQLCEEVVFLTRLHLLLTQELHKIVFKK